MSVPEVTAMDWTHPYSAGRRAHRQLQSQGLRAGRGGHGGGGSWAWGARGCYSRGSVDMGISLLDSVTVPFITW